MQRLVVAMRGRGEGWKQQLEWNHESWVNSLTTVAKDNLILEIRSERTQVNEVPEQKRTYGSG